MMRCLLLVMVMLQAADSAVQPFATRAFTVYIKEQPSGFFLEGRARRALYPFLSRRLQTTLDDAKACQADWGRQQPKGSTDKPPYVDGFLLSTMPDGMPTSFALGSIADLGAGRYEVAVDFVRRETNDLIKWRDAVIVTKEGDRLVIDDVVYGADDTLTGTGRLSTSFRECRGRRWVGGG